MPKPILIILLAAALVVGLAVPAGAVTWPPNQNVFHTDGPCLSQAQYGPYIFTPYAKIKLDPSTESCGGGQAEIRLVVIPPSGQLKNIDCPVKFTGTEISDDGADGYCTWDATNRIEQATGPVGWIAFGMRTTVAPAIYQPNRVVRLYSAY